MKVRWKYLWMVVAVLVAGFVIFRQLTHPGLNRRVVLPDGREVTVRALTVGTNSTYVAGNLFQRTVGPRLPDKLKARFRVRQMRVTPDPLLRGTEPLTAWVEIRPATNTVIVRVADESGLEQVAALPNVSGGALPPDRWVSAHVFTSYPKRSRFLNVRVYSIGTAPLSKMADIRVPNPTYGKYPSDWKREPLPITRETNGIKFAVTEFNTGLYATGHVANMGSNWTEIVYESDAGPWRPMLVTLTDSTGNQISHRQPMQRLMSTLRSEGAPMTFDPARQGVISLPATCWLDEPAWHVHLEMERYQRASFRSNEWWEINDVPLPRPGVTNRLNIPSPRHGTNAVFKSIAVYGEGTFRVRIDLARSAQSGLLVSLLQVTDQRGTNMYFTRGTPTRGVADAYLLDAAAAKAETLNFRLAVHHRLIMDFRAKPRLLHTNIAKDKW